MVHKINQVTARGWQPIQYRDSVPKLRGVSQHVPLRWILGWHGPGPLIPLDWEGDPMAPASPTGARKSPVEADYTCGSCATRLSGIARWLYSWEGSALSPPPVLCPDTHHDRKDVAMSPPHAVMAGRLQELRRIGGWGSGSPLTRAFAGSKPLQRRRPYLPLRVLQGLADWPLSS